MLGLSTSLKGLHHKVSKGTLREILVSGAVRQFLPNQLTVSSGIVVNAEGLQSRQMDIVIFDNRVLPPFVCDQQVGIIPSQAVVATIEVKSSLMKKSITDASAAASEMVGTVCNEPGSPRVLPPLAYVFAFYGKGPGELGDEAGGRVWLGQNASSLVGIVLAGRFSWMVVQGEWRRSGVAGPPNYEETKRFLALLVDNCRTVAELNWQQFASQHRDWLGAYIREM
jgi:hypothetical protein